MQTRKTHETAYRLEYIDPTNCQTSRVRILQADGTPRVETPSDHDALQWLIDHGEHAAILRTDDADQLVFILTEPEPGLFDDVNQMTHYQIALAKYTQGKALVVQIVPNDDPIDDLEDDEPDDQR